MGVAEEDFEGAGVHKDELGRKKDETEFSGINSCLSSWKSIEMDSDHQRGALP